MMLPSVTLCLPDVGSCFGHSKSPPFSPLQSPLVSITGDSPVIDISESSDDESTDLCTADQLRTASASRDPLESATKHIADPLESATEHIATGHLAGAASSNDMVYLEESRLSPLEYISLSPPSSPESATLQDFTPQPVLTLDQIRSYRQVYMKEAGKLRSCPHCAFSSPSRKSILRHLKCKHAVVGMECGMCNNTMIPEYDIQCTCKTCLVCSDKFGKQKDLTEHARTQHIHIDMAEYKRCLLPEKAPGCPTDQYHCLLDRSCTFSSNSRAAYIRHMANAHHTIIHRKPLILQCPLCSYKQGRVGKITNHIRKYHMGGGTKGARRKSSLISSILSFGDQETDFVDVVGIDNSNAPDFVDVVGMDDSPAPLTESNSPVAGTGFSTSIPNNYLTESYITPVCSRPVINTGSPTTPGPGSIEVISLI